MVHCPGGRTTDVVWEIKRNALNTIRGISIITLTTLLLVNGIMPLALWTFFFGFTIAITMERCRNPRTLRGMQNEP